MYCIYRDAIVYINLNNKIKRKLSDQFIEKFIEKFEKFTEDEMRGYIIDGFFKVPTWKEISVKNVRDMFSYNTFDRTYEKLASDEKDRVDRLVTAVEKIKRPDSLSEHQHIKEWQHIKGSADDIDPFYVPVVVYWTIRIATKIFDQLMLTEGFKIIEHKNILFYVRENDVPNKKEVLPILFLHGLGFGVMPYYDMIKKLGKDRTIICPIVPNISNMYFHPEIVFNKNNYVENIRTYLKSKNIDKVDMIGHSFGSILMNIMIEKMPDIINKKIYIDPVCFFYSHMKIAQPTYMKFMDILKSNNYRPMGIISYFIFKNIYVQSITRGVLLDELINFHDDDDNSLIVMGDEDWVVDSKSVKNHMDSEYTKTKIIYNDRYDHGDAVYCEKTFDLIRQFLST